MIALYRKYRPQKFSQIFGQYDIKTTLQNAILTNRVVHSYLFSGPRGTGKTTMARVFAKSLNCENRKSDEFEPCNQCYSCKSINDGSFVDLIEIDAASNRKIEDIRNLQELIRFAPRKSNGYKIFILDESHMLTKEAANAFLKTLEEPPHNVIFILATTDPQKMIPTVLSRVQQFNFTPLSATDIYQKLSYILSQEKVSLDKQILNQIINLSMGGARDAESILGKILSYKTNSITTEIAEMIIGKNTYQASLDILNFISSDQITEALKFINSLSESGYDINDFNNNLIKNTHIIFLLSISNTLVNTNSLLEEDKNLLANLSQKKDTKFWSSLLNSLESRKDSIPKYFLPQIPIEIAIVENTLFQSKTPLTENIQDIKPLLESNSPKPIIPNKNLSLDNKNIIQEKPTPIIPKPDLIPKTSKGYDNPFRSKDSSLKKNVEIVAETNQELDIYIIKQKFNEIKQTLNRKFKTFIPIIKVSEPIKYVNNTLTISLPTVFYKNRLVKLAPEIEIILKDVFQKDIKVDCVIEINNNSDIGSDITIENIKNQSKIIDLVDLEDNQEPKTVEKKLVSTEDIKEEFKDYL